MGLVIKDLVNFQLMKQYTNVIQFRLSTECQTLIKFLVVAEGYFVLVAL